MKCKSCGEPITLVPISNCGYMQTYWLHDANWEQRCSLNAAPGELSEEPFHWSESFARRVRKLANKDCGRGDSEGSRVTYYGDPLYISDGFFKDCYFKYCRFERCKFEECSFDELAESRRLEEAFKRIEVLGDKVHRLTITVDSLLREREKPERKEL